MRYRRNRGVDAGSLQAGNYWQKSGNVQDCPKGLWL